MRPRIPPPSSASSLRGPGFASLAFAPANMDPPWTLQFGRIDDGHAAAPRHARRKIGGSARTVACGPLVPHQQRADALGRHQRASDFETPPIVALERVLALRRRSQRLMLEARLAAGAQGPVTRFPARAR